MKALIWDLDGVIADTAPYHFAAWRELFYELGRNYTKRDFQGNFGRRNDDILSEMLGNLSREELNSLSRRKEELFREKIKGRVKPLPGVLQLLEDASSHGFRLALVSSTPPENLKLILSSLSIERYFGPLISDQDVRRGKPDPEGFLLAARRLGVPPDRCIVIEDAVAGVEAAKRAGMRCIAVTTTHPRERLTLADLVVASLEVVSPRVLDSLLP